LFQFDAEDILPAPACQGTAARAGGENAGKSGCCGGIGNDEFLVIDSAQQIQEQGFGIEARADAFGSDC